jgi:hypothetical protein
MTGGIVGRLWWAAIGVGLVLAGCGSAAAPTAQLSHAVSPRGPAKGSAPNARAVQPGGVRGCTEVYCVPQARPRGPATFTANS